MNAKTKRTLVMDLRLVFEGDSQELFEHIKETLLENEDTWRNYAGIEKFRIYERRVRKEEP